MSFLQRGRAQVCALGPPAAGNSLCSSIHAIVLGAGPTHWAVPEHAPTALPRAPRAPSPALAGCDYGKGAPDKGYSCEACTPGFTTDTTDTAPPLPRCINPAGECLRPAPSLLSHARGSFASSQNAGLLLTPAHPLGRSPWPCPHSLQPCV